MTNKTKKKKAVRRNVKATSRPPLGTDLFSMMIAALDRKGVNIEKIGKEWIEKNAWPGPNAQGPSDAEKIIADLRADTAALRAATAELNEQIEMAKTLLASEERRHAEENARLVEETRSWRERCHAAETQLKDEQRLSARDRQERDEALKMLGIANARDNRDAVIRHRSKVDAEALLEEVATIRAAADKASLLLRKATSP